MKKLLIVSNEQFGYHTDTYKYVENLKNQYDIFFLCLDHENDKVIIDNVKIIYVKKSKNNKINNVKLLINCITLIKKYNIDITFTMYFRLCNFIPIISRKAKHILDIRTGVISNNQYILKKGNENIRNACKYFKNISIISEGLINYLRIDASNKNITVLPLGADINNKVVKINKNKFTFCYVGILSERKINDTLKAFIRFSEIYDNCEYVIAGYHSIDNLEKDEFFSLVNSNNKIKYLGRVKHEKINSIISQADVGISYIPKTNFYNYQPPTKTYEYLANGVVCIATDTYENKKIINNKNGLLCSDTVTELLDAMIYVYKNINKYNETEIKESIVNNSWFNICINLNNILKNLK